MKKRSMRWQVPPDPDEPPDPPRAHPPSDVPRYIVKLQQMRRDGLVPAGTVLRECDVTHNEWCDLLSGRGLCNCDPDIRLKPTPYD